MRTSSDYDKRRKAHTAVKNLISALRDIGWSEEQAVEVAETLIEDAERDGIEVRALWLAIESVAPIPKHL